MTELLKTEALRHIFADGTEGLGGIDLTVGKGDFLLIAGRNGSGKTLLARHLVGLSLPSSGKVLFKGEPLGRDLRALRRSVGYVFQDTDCQILGQTVEEDVAFGPANLGFPPVEIHKRVNEALDEVRLGNAAARRPETLSGGEKRRLAIAGVLAMGSECLILDEPFANLDYESALDLAALCLDLKAGGKTLVVVTHELEKILHLADRLVVLEGGLKIYDGDPQDPDPGFFPAHGLACPYEIRRIWSPETIER
ncbi:MAG: ABC transporter ATP-binding protein [Spirochaetes bacterium]|nr:ABC transporter ATP-binding protein [Spirochaetota bacterium]